MPYDGLNSVNFTDHGQSRENLLALNRRIGGAYPLVRNGPEMTRILANDGFRPIYRQTNDDPQANPLARSADEFVKELVANAPDAALYHLTNEIEDPLVHPWTKDALDYANSIKGTNAPKLVIYNHATNKSRALWNACRANIELAASTGHAVGVHLYDDLEHLDGAYDWLDIKREVGGLWMFTEIAYIRSIFDAHKGWRNHYPAAEYVRLIEKHVRVAAIHNMPLIWFSPEPWPLGSASENGFAFGDDEAIVAQLATLNTANKISTPAPVPPPIVSPPVIVPPTAPLPDWQPRRLRAADPRGILRSTASQYSGAVFKFEHGVDYEVLYDVEGNKPDTLLPDLIWQSVRYKTAAGELRGYIRTDAAELLPLASPVEPEPTPEPPVVVEPPGGTTPVTFTVDELHAISSSLQTIYAHNALVIESLREMNDAISSLRLVIAEAVGRAKRAA